MNSNTARHNHPPESGPLDWDHAVQAATMRLQEEDIMPDTASHPLLADQAARLAALLCAYGMLADETDRMQARLAEPSVTKRPTGMHRRIRPAGKLPQRAVAAA